MDLTGATTGAPSSATQLVPAANQPQDQQLFQAEYSEAELQHQIVSNEEKTTEEELAELQSTSKATEEQLQQLQTRLAIVTQELSHVKLSNRLMGSQLGDEEVAADVDENLEMVAYRDVSSMISAAFQQAVHDKLRDPVFAEKLGDQNLSSRPVFCRVIWEDESADWKVQDPRDNTEVSFGALLEDVSRYWGLDHEAMCFTDESGALWPLQHYVYDELSGNKEALEVHLRRMPNRRVLGHFEVAYEIDETTLPIAVRRRLNRERREKEAQKQTRESIRKERQRERSAQFRELIKYTLMMALYFSVLFWRRDVTSYFYFLDSINECFVGEEFGDYNEKGFMDIANYEEFFQWARGPFAEGLLPDENYDGSEIKREKQRVMVYNKIVGGLRVRQTRVTPNAGCDIALNVQEVYEPVTGPDAGIIRKRSYVKQCYSKYVAGDTWSRRPFGPMDRIATPDGVGLPGRHISPDLGPEECRSLYDDHMAGTFDDAMDYETYDTYLICLGNGDWPRDELLVPRLTRRSRTAQQLADAEANLTYAEAGYTEPDPLLRAFTWQDEKANDLEGFERRLKYATYDGSGFVYDLVDVTGENLAEALDYLESEAWLDRQTRAVFVSLVVYNANLNLYAAINFELELSLAGVFIPRYNLQAAQMDLYFNMFDSFGNAAFVVVESLLYVGMLGYLFNEFREVKDIYSATGSALGYFRDFWNVIDWFLILLSFGAFAMRLNFVMMPAVREFRPYSEEYQEITAAVTLYNLSFSLDALAATFGLVKIFRYFDLQENLLVLRDSIARGVADLSVFTLMLLTMMFGFCVAGMNIFGQESDNYIDIERSFTALFLMVLGEFDFDEMYAINPGFAYGFFIMYQFFIFLIMVNIFLAILNDAYLAVKEKHDADRERDKDLVVEPLTMRQRLRKMRDYVRQEQLDRRIEYLRKEQRQRELREKREMRKVEQARAKTLKAIGMAASNMPEQGGTAAKGKARSGAKKAGTSTSTSTNGGGAPRAREDPQSALLRNEQL